MKLTAEMARKQTIAAQRQRILEEMNNIEATINRAIERGENVAYIIGYWIDDTNEKQLRDNGFIVHKKHMQDYGRITRIEW